ncbi:MAG: site-specific integrase [Opitutales bacterium]
MKGCHVLFVDMLGIVEGLLTDRGLDAATRERWLIVLRWYLGYCAKHGLKDPTDREHGRWFWRDAVLPREPSDWQREQWGQVLAWFFDTMEKRDRSVRLMRSVIRRRHLRYRTEQSYLGWLRRFQAFVDGKDAMDADEGDVVRFLSHLAEEEQLAASGQRQAFNALLFFFRHVLERPDVRFEGAVRAKERKRDPGFEP